MDQDRLEQTALYFFVGKTYERELEFTDENDQPIDLTGFTWSMKIRARQSPNAALIATVTVSAGSASNKILITLDDGITTTIPPGTYYHELTGTLGEPQVYMRGPAVFEATI